jgi:glyoxylase-like metal-dependent hydrolase (beta-lactamase superfamily II)
LTHGHFDHVGPLETLAKDWDVPVYAHMLEHRYLNGTESYPPPDPTVGGGLMSLLSPLYPRKPVDIDERLRPLRDDGSVPGMPGWRWLHTPGHTPGHVSLWREIDRLLVAGDAFITTRQESAYAAITQAPEMHGPPMYFTPDWVSARASVQSLAALSPDVVITGHGQAMQGQEMRAGSQFGIADADWGAKSNFWFRASLRRGGGKTEIGSGSCPVSTRRSCAGPGTAVAIARFAMATLEQVFPNDIR